MSQIADASGDQKKLFKIVAKLLQTDHDTPLPTCDSFDALAEQFSDFFSEKSRKSGVNLLQVLTTWTSTLMVNPKHAY